MDAAGSTRSSSSTRTPTIERSTAPGSRPVTPMLSSRGRRLRLDRLRDLGAGCEPDIALGLGVTDDLLQDPNARTRRDDVRMLRGLKQSAGRMGRIELAQENIEHVLWWRVRPQRLRTVYHEIDRVVADPFRPASRRCRSIGRRAADRSNPHRPSAMNHKAGRARSRCAACWIPRSSCDTQPTSSTAKIARYSAVGFVLGDVAARQHGPKQPKVRLFGSIGGMAHLAMRSVARAPAGCSGTSRTGAGDRRVLDRSELSSKCSRRSGVNACLDPRKDGAVG